MTKKALSPKLIVIAGPNGAGKTTFTNQVLRHDWSAGCVFINPDEIAKQDFGDWNSPELHEWGQMMIGELAKPARTASEPG